MKKNPPKIKGWGGGEGGRLTDFCPDVREM